MQRRWVLAALALTPAILTLPARGAVYLSAEDARKQLFEGATRFADISFTPDDAANAAVNQALGTPQKPRRVTAFAAYDAGGKLLGHVLYDSVIGKFELIDYAVAFGPDASVLAVEVLAYRESHGQEIRLPAWRKQFVGHKGAGQLRFGEEIKNISGATLSCRHITEGVQRLAVLAQRLAG